MSYSIVQGTLDPPMPITVYTGGDVAFAIDEETDTVVLKYKDPDGVLFEVELDITSEYVEAPPVGELVNGTAGQLRRIWQAGETDIPGVYLGRIFVTREGRTRGFPSESLPFVWTVEPII